jgi:hypothetical protein
MGSVFSRLLAYYYGCCQWTKFYIKISRNFVNNWGFNTHCSQHTLQSTHIADNTSCSQQTLQSTHFAVNIPCSQHTFQSTHIADNTSCSQKTLQSTHLAVNTHTKLKHYCIQRFMKYYFQVSFESTNVSSAEALYGLWWNLVLWVYFRFCPLYISIPELSSTVRRWS